MGKIEVLRIPFTLNDLDCLDNDEKVFFFQAGGMINEIISLQRFVYISSQGSENELIRVAENSQALYFCRHLASTLYESWEAITTARNCKIRGAINNSLDMVAIAELDRLKAYFSKSNLCKTVRNKLAYHYDFEKLSNIISKWPLQEKLEIILSDYHVNCRYVASDIISNYAIFELTNCEENAKKFLSEIIEIARAFVEYLSACMTVLLKRIYQKTQLMGTKEQINVPSIHECSLGYFVGND